MAMQLRPAASRKLQKIPDGPPLSGRPTRNAKRGYVPPYSASFRPSASGPDCSPEFGQPHLRLSRERGRFGDAWASRSLLRFMGNPGKRIAIFGVAQSRAHTRGYETPVRYIPGRRPAMQIPTTQHLGGRPMRLDRGSRAISETLCFPAAAVNSRCDRGWPVAIWEFPTWSHNRVEDFRIMAVFPPPLQRP